MPRPLDPLAALLGWLFVCPCPLCGRSRREPSPAGGLCRSCRERLALPSGGLHGRSPLPWWAAGAYAGGLRHALLDLRRRPCRGAVVALAETIRPPQPARAHRPRLVVIPSWKRPANPLPPLLGQALAASLGWEAVDLLERSRPVLGQHHLNRRLRRANQQDAFLCRRGPRGGERLRNPLLIVDDILTTGATAESAAAVLRRAGWKVEGMLCLARTPAGRGRPGRDLESACCRDGDAPG